VNAPAVARPPLVWKRTRVDGREARYAVIGEGLPVLFLHGWALAHHTYRGVVTRIATRGCRVFVPALPGFEPWGRRRANKTFRR
jgi:pimeloyl-ACP methyl ester carboxylesterase